MLKEIQIVLLQNMVSGKEKVVPILIKPDKNSKNTFSEIEKIEMGDYNEIINEDYKEDFNAIYNY